MSLIPLLSLLKLIAFAAVPCILRRAHLAISVAGDAIHNGPQKDRGLG